MFEKDDFRANSGFMIEKIVMLRGFTTISRLIVTCLLLIPVSAGWAAGLDGAWANKPENCAKVFRKSGDRISVGSSSDVFGKWFILEKDRIRGRRASCRINLRKQDGPIVHLMAICRSGIAIQDVHFSLKSVGEARLRQVFPGVSDLEIEYVRCAL